MSRKERQKESEEEKKKISICNLFLIYRLESMCKLTFRYVPWQYH